LSPKTAETSSGISLVFGDEFRQKVFLEMLGMIAKSGNNPLG
jgi:hypothetical protein